MNKIVRRAGNLLSRHPNMENPREYNRIVISFLKEKP